MYCTAQHSMISQGDWLNEKSPQRIPRGAPGKTKGRKCVMLARPEAANKHKFRRSGASLWEQYSTFGLSKQNQRGQSNEMYSTRSTAQYRSKLMFAFCLQALEGDRTGNWISSKSTAFYHTLSEQPFQFQATPDWPYGVSSHAYISLGACQLDVPWMFQENLKKLV